MKNILFIAVHDIRHQLRQGSTLLWLLVMPPVFFFFIGTVTSGFSSGMSDENGTPLVVKARSPGFLKNQIDLRLRESGFEPEWRDSSDALTEQDSNSTERSLELSDNLTQIIISDQQVTAHFETTASSILRDYETIRVNRALYTALADTVVSKTLSGEDFSASSLTWLNSQPRIWQLQSAPAGNRQTIPSGFAQAIPGTLVMFTLLILLTSGASLLTNERKQGLLRRLASAPLSRSEILAGKWAGRMVLAMIQIGISILMGTFAFQMEWGPDLFMVIIILTCWAAFCASAGLLLGSIAGSEGQAAGLGVLIANALAALGGCWWPIEITPAWMQFVQNLLPTGWTMDALHRLISFEAGATSVLPHATILLTAALIVALLAVKRFQYE